MFGSLTSALAGLGVADDDLEQAVGQAGLLEDGGEHRAAADRRLRVRLEDDGIAQRQGGRDHAHAEDTGRVPRSDRADDAHGHAADHAQALLLDGRHEGAIRLPRHRRSGEHLTGREVLFVVHLVAMGAGLALRPRSELGPMRLVDLRRAPQDSGPLLVRRRGPRGLSFGRGRGGLGDICRR